MPPSQSHRDDTPLLLARPRTNAAFNVILNGASAHRVQFHKAAGPIFGCGGSRRLGRAQRALDRGTIIHCRAVTARAGSNSTLCGSTGRSLAGPLHLRARKAQALWRGYRGLRRYRLDSAGAHAHLRAARSVHNGSTKPAIRKVENAEAILCQVCLSFNLSRTVERSFRPPRSLRAPLFG
jgi:hypothetical protein